MATNPPLKRHAALIELSKDHHFGLLLCWKLRKGFSKGISESRMAAYVVSFFKNQLESHFRLEEELVFPVLPIEDTLNKEARRQHSELRHLFQLLHSKAEGRLAALNDFEQKLEAHIRFEERHLFMEVQQRLTEAELQALQQKVEAVHIRKEEVWEDRFWL